MAGPHNKNIQKLFFWEEPDRDSFAIDHSGTIGDFELVPTIEGSIDFDPGEMFVDPGHTVHHPNDWREEIPTHRVWSLSFQVPFATSGVLPADTEAASPSLIGAILKHVLGGRVLGTTTTAAAAWGTPDSGDGTVVTSLEPGMAIAHESADGRIYGREIRQKVGDTLSLKAELPAAPGIGELLYGGQTIYLTRDPKTFAQFMLIGEHPDDRYVFLGGAGTVSIALPMTGEAPPTLTFEFQGRAWKYGEEAATDLSLQPFNPEAYADYNPISDHVGEFIEQAVGVRALTQKPIKEISFEVNTPWTPMTNPQKPEGLAFWYRARQNEPTLTGSFMPTFLEDLTRQKRRDNRDKVYLAKSFGTTLSSGLILLTAATAQYTETPPGESDGVAVETISWKGRNDTDTVEATPSDLGLSNFRIHIFG